MGLKIHQTQPKNKLFHCKIYQEEISRMKQRETKGEKTVGEGRVRQEIQ